MKSFYILRLLLSVEVVHELVPITHVFPASLFIITSIVALRSLIVLRICLPIILMVIIMFLMTFMIRI